MARYEEQEHHRQELVLIETVPSLLGPKERAREIVTRFRPAKIEQLPEEPDEEPDVRNHGDHC